MDDTSTGRHFEYTHEADRLKTVTSPTPEGLPVVSTYEYAPGTNELSAVIHPEGRRTTIAYWPDGTHRVRELTRAGPSAPVTSFAYFA